MIDETGASQMLLPESNGARRRSASRRSRRPSRRWRASRRRPCRRTTPRCCSTSNDDLKRVVFGQDKAIEALTSAIKLARAGLRDRREADRLLPVLRARPASARPRSRSQLAAALGVELIRFDMSEYMERHTVSRLIGAPPGYVGFDQGGLLTDGIDQHPHCVLLLDEIEKAHPDLFNILLQVMDHGKLTDHNGKQVDFRNVILIMTTNAGAADLAKPAYRLHAAQARGRRHTRRSTGCSRRSSATGSTPSSRSAQLPHGGRRQGRRQVRHAARGAARRPQRHDRAHRRGARLAGRARLRRDDGRPPDGAADPGARSRSRSPTRCCSAS